MIQSYLQFWIAQNFFARVKISTYPFITKNLCDIFVSILDNNIDRISYLIMIKTTLRNGSLKFDTVSIVPDDGLVPLGAGTSADIVATKLISEPYINGSLQDLHYHSLALSHQYMEPILSRLIKSLKISILSEYNLNEHKNWLIHLYYTCWIHFGNPKIYLHLLYFLHTEVRWIFEFL